MYITRHLEQRIVKIKEMFKVLLITGPRQVGKTTMLKHLFGKEYHYVTLDDITALDIAKNDPKLFFKNYPSPIIIDEIQLAPILFREIKRIVDESDNYGQIIITGSQTFHLMQEITETLAGRIAILTMQGLSLREIQKDLYYLPFIPTEEALYREQYNANQVNLWKIIHNGSLPELYNVKQLDWQLYYASYVRTYIERDVRSLLNVKSLDKFSKFMVQLAGRTAQLLNYAGIANDIGVDIKTIQSWVKVLESSGIITIVQPFSNNALQRTIKAPMLYFNDTGLVCYLLRWTTEETLKNGAMSGPILETFAVSEVIKSFINAGIQEAPIFYYRDKDQKEIDLIVEDNGVLYPIEIKKTMNPSNRMGKNLNILHKAIGYHVKNDMILCLVENMIYINDNLIAYPISKI